MATRLDLRAKLFAEVMLHRGAGVAKKPFFKKWPFWVSFSAAIPALLLCIYLFNEALTHAPKFNWMMGLCTVGTFLASLFLVVLPLLIGPLGKFVPEEDELPPAPTESDQDADEELADDDDEVVASGDDDDGDFEDDDDAGFDDEDDFDFDDDDDFDM